MKLHEELHRMQDLAGIPLTEQAKDFREILKWTDKKYDQTLKAPGIVPLPAWKKLIAADEAIDDAIEDDEEANRNRPSSEDPGDEATANEDAAHKLAVAEGKRFQTKNKGLVISAFVASTQAKSSIDILVIILDGEKNDKRVTQKWAETYMVPALQKKFPDNTFTIKNVKTGNLAAHGGERIEEFTQTSEMDFDIIVG